MTHRIMPLLQAGLIALALATGLTATDLGPARRLDAWCSDAWHALAGKRFDPSHVALVLLDDDALRLEPDRPLVFWGPIYAKVLARLREIKVAAIGMDIQPAISPVTWMDAIGATDSRNFDRAFMVELSKGLTLLAGSVNMVGGRPTFSLPAPDYLIALPGHEDDIGLTNVPLDRDGVVRRFAPALFNSGSPRLTLAAALTAKVDPRAPGLAGLGTPSALTPRPIAYVGPPGTIPRVSFARLLAKDALADPAVTNLRGKVVIVGIDIHGAHDRLATPYSLPLFGSPREFMPGPEIHANIVEDLLAGHNLSPVPLTMAAVVWLAFLTLGSYGATHLSPGRSFLTCLGLVLGAYGLGYGLFLDGRLLPEAGLWAGLGLVWAGTNARRLTRGERDKARIRQAFGKYVSEAALASILASGAAPSPGGDLATVTVLFSDIRGFTSLSEKLSPHDVVELLNAYFTRACRVIQDQGGMIDKFIGDAVMAVFGAPMISPDHARQAVTAALHLVDTAREFESWVRDHFPQLGPSPFHIGVGLHSGPVIVGNIGSLERLDFTVIGDTVNTASRLEGVTKEMGCPIVASQATIDLAGPTVLTGRAQQAQVKGKREPVPVHEILGLAEVSEDDHG